MTKAKPAAKKAGGKKLGAPPKPPRVRDQVLEMLEQGSSLAQACAAARVNERTVFRWAESDEDFRHRYERARATGYELMGERLIDDATVGTGDIARDKLIVDTKKWYLSKVLPKKYGDRSTVDVNIDAADSLIKALAAGTH